MRKLRILLIVVLSAVLFFLSLTSGGFLVVNNPQPGDVIVVLAGETDRRPALGLELLSRGYAPRMLLDVPADAKIYQWSMLDLSQQYIQKLPHAESVLVCPISGRSTKAEAQDVLQCLQKLRAHSVLVVTSDYHTRRALSTFQHELLGYQVSVAAASDPQQFGGSWWRHRQWAKLNFDEWLRLVWWEGIDRWRR
jgi:uncharacterized SAM-binding protein YcdF (DUF218 family)